MAYLMVMILLIAVAGLVLRAVLAAQRERSPGAASPGAQDITSTDTRPPNHPDEPIPGSDTARHGDAMP